MASESESWKGSLKSTAATLYVPSLPESDRRRSAPTILRDRLRYLRRPSDNFASSFDDVKGPLGLTLLHEPSEPHIDFIFVHGLGGGSRKTWSASEDIDTFWPQQWLPYERGFKHVRIHSFGYDSDWSKIHQSTLTIHDFAQALLGELHNSPDLKRHGDTPLVFVAHSMGGLVVKKSLNTKNQAYLSTKTDPTYKKIGERIHSLYFLGTPHRGADSTQFLKKMISVSFSGTKTFVNELIPGSGTLQTVNDDFRHVCQNVQLWSFFEGSPTSAGMTSIMIVNKDSATIGLPHEHIQYLPADHRHICKFTSISDPCYVTLLRCFGTTIEHILKDVSAKRNDDYKSQMKLISSGLNDAQRPESDLSRALDKQYPGSCQWITDNSTFQAWVNAEELDLCPPKTSPEATCRLLWVNGPPGSGKSIAAGHVIKHLETLNQDCAYYFFKSSTKTSVSQLLLSFAFQMAETNFEVRRVFLSLISEGEIMGSEDHNVIWNSLFLGHLLKIPFPQPQYWVIDALDECPSRALPTLMQMITRIDPIVPIKLLITSRPNGDVERILGQEKLRKFELRTGQHESLADIAAYLKSRLLSDGDGWQPEENDGKDIVTEILEKSKGIFLWASLISTRLDEVYSVEQKRDVLRQVPPEMNGVYSEILDAMKGSLRRDLAHCILKWVICAPQPLTTEEVKAAVWVDIRQTLRSTEKIAQICGNLIVVDQDSNVQLMHQTVREFLIGDESGNYINRSQAHRRIAELCLNRLNDKVFDPPRSRALTASSNDADYDAIDKYASTHFSYHLAHCSKTQGSDDVVPTASLMELLACFFETNILTWIERTAKHGKLVHFTRSIQNLRSYFTRHLLNHSPLDSDFQMVESMVEDLARLLAIFGPNLADVPSSIYGLIPALCPTTSTFYTRFGRGLRQQLIASFNHSWDERLSCFIYQSRVYSVASNDQYLAVGLHSGEVQLYKGATLELAVSIKHGEPVRQMTFGTISSVLAVCGPRYLSVWNTQQALLWRCAVSPIPLSVSFSADDSKALVCLRSGVVLSFSVEEGIQVGSLPVLDDSSDSDSDESHSNAHGTTAFVMRLCPALDLMAAAFRNSHLVIRHIEQDEKIGTFEKEGCEGWDHPPQILDIVFNPVPELNLVAASYLDGEIVTFDPWTRRQKNVVQIYCNTLACSPDGRTLAAGDNEGAIHLFGFDTLKIMYRISTLPERIMGLVFASNSLRLFDIRGSSANVWEPWVLIRRNTADDSSSEAEDHTTIVPEARFTRSFELGRSIVAMTQAGSSHLICGREDGLISVHNLQTNEHPLELQYHARAVPIQLVDWHAKTRTLFSLDVSGRCIAVRFSSSWSHETIFDHRASSTVKQSLVKPDGSAYLLSTNEGEEYWENGQASFATSTHCTASSRWVLHPTNPTHLLLIDVATIHIFQWKELKRETPESGIPLKLDTSIPAPPNSEDWFHRSGNDHLVQIHLASDISGLFLLDLSQTNSTSTNTSVRFLRKDLLPEVKHLLGVHKSDLYFITRQGWVCSMSMKTIANPASYTRHFFIPPLWQNGREFIGKVLASRKSVAFAYRDELVIFRDFLEYAQKISL